MTSTLHAFLTEAEILKEIESGNESDIEDDDVSDTLLNNMSDSDEDCDVSGHDSGNDACLPCREYHLNWSARGSTV